MTTIRRLCLDGERIERLSCPEPNSGCWLWTGWCVAKGYGQIRIGGRIRQAHRTSYEIFVGPIHNGLVVRHKCDTPACVNPQHLELGTHADNVRDMVTRGRQAKGERLSTAKLTEEDVIAIRLDNRTERVVAKQYGVCHRTVGQIRRGVAWGHVLSGGE